MYTLGFRMASRGERVNYLSLALQARSAIKRLKLLIPPHQPAVELKSALQAAVNSLSGTNSQQGLCSKLYDEAGFNRFEEIQTVEEVIGALDDPSLKGGIERILVGEKYTEGDVRTTLRFFAALENRALYHYDDPSLAESFR
jgi:hypothetical protein